MTPQLIRYGFDPTGLSPNNFVKGETHTLATKRFRAIAPFHGVFYTDSVVLTDAVSNKPLIHGQDYVFAELHQALTLEIGKEIAGIVLVTNTGVSSDTVISYQCVGDYHSVAPETLISLLKKKTPDGESKSFYDLDGKPTAFTPSPHMHDLGDMRHMEPLLYAIERVRYAIAWGDAKAVSSLLRLVDETLAIQLQDMKNRVNTELLAMLVNFKNNFTATFIGLGKVANYGLASKEDGAFAFEDNFTIMAWDKDRYVSTEGLSLFKERVYSEFVSSSTTNLGKAYGKIIVPMKASLQGLLAGETVLFDSFKAQAGGAVNRFDEAAFPSLVNKDTRWTMMKVINKENNSGSIILAAAMLTGEFFTGDISVNLNGSISIAWTRHLGEVDAEDLLKTLLAHMEDKNNPHRVWKSQTQLGNVENLPVATREDVVCRKPTRKYITYDLLLLFMKAFITGIKSPDDIHEDITSPSVLEQYQTIFAPCGPCGSLQQIKIESCPPAGELIAEFCDENDHKVGVYTDGKCGYERKRIGTGVPPPPPPPPSEPPPPAEVINVDLTWFSNTARMNVYEVWVNDRELDEYPGLAVVEGNLKTSWDFTGYEGEGPHNGTFTMDEIANGVELPDQAASINTGECAVFYWYTPDSLTPRNAAATFNVLDWTGNVGVDELVPKFKLIKGTSDWINTSGAVTIQHGVRQLDKAGGGALCKMLTFSIAIYSVGANKKTLSESFAAANYEYIKGNLPISWPATESIYRVDLVNANNMIKASSFIYFAGVGTPPSPLPVDSAGKNAMDYLKSSQGLSYEDQYYGDTGITTDGNPYQPVFGMVAPWMASLDDAQYVNIEANLANIVHRTAVYGFEPKFPVWPITGTKLPWQAT